MDERTCAYAVIVACLMGMGVGGFLVWEWHRAGRGAMQRVWGRRVEQMRGGAGPPTSSP